ncbi:hypothetical protein [Enterococcus sp. BWR-S5]|uniref:hypothetical protein n=1 Tax=Enterococcus sp. BWR-S5 TaxID=2787714 RepID=UPI001920AB06|nr:hypothetical protein [Enterococcus sp. BWR-S5]MBL1225350.1 hypothetical protein [Enterococcus sp. BWR-S5]
MKLDTELIEELLNSSVSSYKISIATGISRQMIGKLRNGQADFHKGSLENAVLLHTFALEQKEAGSLKTKGEAVMKEVETKEELLYQLKKKADEIFITGELAAEIYELQKGQLSDTERMGVELGSGGMQMLIEYVFIRLFEMNEQLGKEEKKMRRTITQLYYIKKISTDTVLLRLKQLDY